MEKLKRAVFWGYNRLYLIFFCLLAIEAVFIGRLKFVDILTFGGFYPPHVLAAIYVFALTPFLTMAIAHFTRIGKSASGLIKLFFGFEIPIMGLSFIRIIFIRQMTPVVWVLFAGIVLSVIGLLIHLYHPHIQSRKRLTFLMVSQQIAVIVMGYAFLLAFFFLPIVLAFFIKQLSRIGLDDIITFLSNVLMYGGFFQYLFVLSFMMIAALTLSFFTVGPVGAFMTYWGNWGDLADKVQKKFGGQYMRVAGYGVAIFYITLISLVSVQAGVNGLGNLMSQYRNAQTFEERQQAAEPILKKEREIKNTLTSSYLAQYRYFSDSTMNILQQGYTNELGVSSQSAKLIQKLFNDVAGPFIYAGVFEEDIKHSSVDYAELFDNPIQKGELSSIRRTLDTTNTRDSLKAGILDIDKKTVRLVSRAIIVNSHMEGLLATVTIEEEYENTSKEQQEVYYEFSLPDNAVITDLKLGPDLEIGANAADKPQAVANAMLVAGPSVSPVKVDSAVVAARGAANTVYENQIFRRSDPALLVQVGPRQYKLRVFPIPIKGRTVDGLSSDNAKNQKVRFSYVTLRTGESAALPLISEQRNIFADENSKYSHTLNGRSLNVARDAQFIQIPGSLPCFKNIFETQTPLGSVAYIPHTTSSAFAAFSCQHPFLQADKTIRGKKIALLLDASYSNAKINWTEYLEKSFPMMSLISDNNVDAYFFNDMVSQKFQLTEDLLKDLNVFHIGKTDRMRAVAAVAEGDYDLIFMVTDGSPSSRQNPRDYGELKSPVYVIHDGKIPPYEDGLMYAVIQSNGRVVTSGYEALEHYWQGSFVNSLEMVGTILETDEFGSWVLLNKGIRPVLPIQTPDRESGFAQLAQQRLVFHTIRNAGSLVHNVEFLDTLDRISQESFIVTPYSSMIVLVTDWQRQQLANALKENNRYELALDTGEEALANPSGRGILEIGAVPEPHEWLLLLTGFLVLGFVYRKQIKQKLKSVEIG